MLAIYLNGTDKHKPTDAGFSGLPGQVECTVHVYLAVFREWIWHFVFHDVGAGGGVDVCRAGIGGRRGGAYSAAKGGLGALTQHIACDYGPRGIRANCVAPGVTMTDMVRHRFDDEMFKRVNVETTPFPRLGEVEDIASTIAFLCSPGAGFINGQTIVVDGGWTTTKYLSPRALTTKWVEPDAE